MHRCEADRAVQLGGCCEGGPPCCCGIGAGRSGCVGAAALHARWLSLNRCKEVRSTLREAANQLSNKLSHAQHLDEVTWTTKNWHGLQMQRLSVVLHTAVAWQTVTS